MSKTYTVMIVDDSPEDRYLLKRYLRKTELSLVLLEVGGGSEAIDLLTTSAEELTHDYPGISPPVTLFLDINMPLMNGWEFIEELQNRRGSITLEPTIVMMYSTSESDYDKKKASEYDAISNYIVKGVSTPDNLKAAIVSSTGLL